MINLKIRVSKLILIVGISCLVAFSSKINAQNIYSLKNSSVSIFAGTPVEDIDATNLKSVSFLNISTGEFQISIPINSFKFKRALMEEHFNENYLESEKYPKAELKGKILDISNYSLTKEGTYHVMVDGNLMLHGITKSKKIAVIINNIGNNKLEATSNFQIKLEEFAIERPQIVWEKLAETVTVKVNYQYELYKK